MRKKTEISKKKRKKYYFKIFFSFYYVFISLGQKLYLYLHIVNIAF